MCFALIIIINLGISFLMTKVHVFWPKCMMLLPSSEASWLFESFVIVKSHLDIWNVPGLAPAFPKRVWKSPIGPTSSDHWQLPTFPNLSGGGPNKVLKSGLALLSVSLDEQACQHQFELLTSGPIKDGLGSDDQVAAATERVPELGCFSTFFSDFWTFQTSSFVPPSQPCRATIFKIVSW